MQTPHLAFKGHRLSLAATHAVPYLCVRFLQRSQGPRELPYFSDRLPVPSHMVQ